MAAAIRATFINFRGEMAHFWQGVFCALALFLTARVARLRRSDAAFELKVAGLALGSLRATPCVLDCDLVMFCGGRSPSLRATDSSAVGEYEISLRATAWLVPPPTRPIDGAIPLAPIAC